MTLQSFLLLGKTTSASVQQEKPQASGEKLSHWQLCWPPKWIPITGLVVNWMFVNRINGFITPLDLQDELSSGRGEGLCWGTEKAQRRGSAQAAAWGDIGKVQGKPLVHSTLSVVFWTPLPLPSPSRGAFSRVLPQTLLRPRSHFGDSPGVPRPLSQLQLCGNSSQICISSSVLSPGLPVLYPHPHPPSTECLHSAVPQAGQAQQSKRNSSSCVSSSVKCINVTIQSVPQAGNLGIICDSPLFLSNHGMSSCHCLAWNLSLDPWYPQDDLQSSLF